MTAVQVSGILGNPSKDATGNMSGIGSGHDGSRFMIWSDGAVEVKVDFNQEGRVISKTRKRV
jgi:hypothetical protein